MGINIKQQYGKETSLECCYDFLCSHPEDTIEDIRKRFYYHKAFANNYNYIIYQYYYNYNGDADDYEFRKTQEREYAKLYTLQRLTYDCYLAILLHRLNPEQFKHIITGLCSYFNCSDAKISVPLKDIIKQEKTEYTLTKEQYIGKLESTLHPSTNVGDYSVTPSLGSVIEIEKEIIKPNEEIICLRREKKITYGDLKIFE